QFREQEEVVLLFFAGPVREGQKRDGVPVGVVLSGTRLRDLLVQLQEKAIANLTFYGQGGQVVATTFPEAPRQDPAELGALLRQASTTEKLPEGVAVVGGRSYLQLYFPLRMRGVTLGVLAVALPRDLILTTGATSRWQLAVIFTLAMLGVIAIGYTISRRIIVPILQLVRVSRAVAEGDLEQRTGIRTDDEIGVLAATFDEMTAKLEERTRELEALLKQQREEASKVRAILASIADGVLVEDQEGQIILMNQAAQDLIGQLSEEFAEMGPLQEIPSGPATQREAAQWEERRFRIGDKVIASRTSPVHTDDGERLGNVVIMRDITREAEVDRLKDEFIAQVSHELKTPLTAIKGYSELLLKAVIGRDLNRQQREFLETISRHADTLVEMITELLDFTQLEAGTLGLRQEPFAIDTMVQQVVEEELPRFEEKGIAISVETQEAIPILVGDERRLRWAFRHLVKNAHDYTQPGGEVHVRVYCNDHEVIVEVADTGVGIAPEDQRHLFTRFFRASLDRTVDVRGVGLGLYVAKSIVEMHGGRIWVESELGKGST
ncbi:MAG: HAMP domain-containing protein, partial [Chloroflexi bacterium]